MDRTVKDETARIIEQATVNRRAVEILYLSATRGEETTRVVEPYRLFSVSGRSYLSAWCRTADAVRTFRIDRIREAECLDEPARSFGGDTPFGYEAAPGDLRATLEVTSDADWVTHGVPLEEVEVLADGGYRIVVASPDREFLVDLTLRLGRHVRNVGPAWLRSEVENRVEVLWRLHFGNDTIGT